MLDAWMDRTVNVLAALANCARLHPLDGFDLQEA